MQWHHPVAAVFEMTPRQMHAWLQLGAARHARERAEAIADAALAAQGKADAIRKAVHELSES